MMHHSFGGLEGMMHYLPCWPICSNVAKNQLKGHIAYALLELPIQKIEQLESTSNDVKIQGKLLQKCAHTFISQQELL